MLSPIIFDLGSFIANIESFFQIYLLKIVYNNIHMLFRLFIFSLLFSSNCFSSTENRNIKSSDSNLLDKKSDSFFDPKYDYSNTIGRVSDLSQSKNLLKIWSEDLNLRFLKDGDLLSFRLHNRESYYCTAHVRSTQNNYLIVHVDDWSGCWDKNKYFRRGTLLKIKSGILKKRIIQASVHRRIVMKRKADFLKQMNSINNFVWNYNDEKLKLVTEYDKKIIEIKKAKEIALSRLLDKKNDYLQLQDVLRLRLDNIDNNLKFYKVDRGEQNDRWAQDHHLGLPISRRPYEYSRIKRITQENK